MPQWTRRRSGHLLHRLLTQMCIEAEDLAAGLGVDIFNTYDGARAPGGGPVAQDSRSTGGDRVS